MARAAAVIPARRRGACRAGTCATCAGGCSLTGRSARRSTRRLRSASRPIRRGRCRRQGAQPAGANEFCFCCGVRPAGSGTPPPPRPRRAAQRRAAQRSATQRMSGAPRLEDALHVHASEDPARRRPRCAACGGQHVASRHRRAAVGRDSARPSIARACVLQCPRRPRPSGAGRPCLALRPSGAPERPRPIVRLPVLTRSAPRTPAPLNPAGRSRLPRRRVPRCTCVCRSLDDTASSESALEDFVSSNKDEFDVICMIQPTSPLTQPTDFPTRSPSSRRRRRTRS